MTLPIETRFDNLPAVSTVLADPRLHPAGLTHSHASIADAVRAEIGILRTHLSHGHSRDVDFDDLIRKILARLEWNDALKFRRVINATGIVLHTNLGRSVLSDRAATAAFDAARGYLNLELDLATGLRSSRQDNIRAGLCRLTGAEAATAVNNCAAATVIVLRALAAGKEVLVSRGQLLEIGGGFRIPDILAASGATLREVGTTNITRIGDYAAAIGPDTGLLMRIHTSNFRIRGFTKSVGIGDLVALGKHRDIPVVDDVGSGSAFDLAPFGLPGEPLVSEGIRAGADLVLFSGDKLLGGPQAGLIAGKKALIDRIERDPLMRAFRLDKMTLAALEATLHAYRDPTTAMRELPTLRMLTTPVSEMRTRAMAFAARLQRLDGLQSVEVIDDVAYAGGGSLPECTLPSIVIAVTAKEASEDAFAAQMRTGTPAVVARIQAGRVQFDLRTVFAEQDEALFQAIAIAAALHSG